MTHVTCRLTAKNRDQLWNPMLGNQVWATFTFTCYFCVLQSVMFCKKNILLVTQTTCKTLYVSCTGRIALASTPNYELEDFVRANFYHPHALADGSLTIWIQENTWEFSMVLSAPCCTFHVIILYITIL